jgi:hypothetical protein
MSSTSAEATRQPAATRQELFEARHDVVRRIHERLPRLDALVEDLRLRIPRARIEAGMLAHLGPAELDILRSGLDEPTFADPDRARLALAEAMRERDALLALGRDFGAAATAPPVAGDPSTRETPFRLPARVAPLPPFAAQAHVASAGTSMYCRRPMRG